MASFEKNIYIFSGEDLPFGKWPKGFCCSSMYHFAFGGTLQTPFDNEYCTALLQMFIQTLIAEGFGRL